MYEHHPVDTPLGAVEMVPVNARTLHVDGNSNGKHIEVRGVKLTVSFHLDRADDGTWALHVPSPRGGPAIYTSHAWPHRNAFQSATPAARKVIEAKLVPFAIEWATAHPELFGSAEVDDARMALGRAQADYDQAQAAAEAAATKLVAAQARFAAATENQPAEVAV